MVTMHARGTFEVRLTPQAADAEAEDSTLGRLMIDKQFHGDLQATSRGQMLTAMTQVQGSAGYVAIERVSGTLQGRWPSRSPMGSIHTSSSRPCPLARER
jgi:Protein of unknown function (DUF3224)